MPNNTNSAPNNVYFYVSAQFGLFTPPPPPPTPTPTLEQQQPTAAQIEEVIQQLDISQKPAQAA